MAKWAKSEIISYRELHKTSAESKIRKYGFFTQPWHTVGFFRYNCQLALSALPATRVLTTKAIHSDSCHTWMANWAAKITDWGGRLFDLFLNMTRRAVLNKLASFKIWSLQRTCCSIYLVSFIKRCNVRSGKYNWSVFTFHNLEPGIPWSLVNPYYMEVTEPFIIIKFKRGKYIFKRQYQRYLPIRNGKYFQKITQNLKSNIMDWKLDGEIIPKSEFSERDYEWAGFKWRNQSLHLHDIFRVAHSNESNFSPENWDFIFFIEPVCFWGPGVTPSKMFVKLNWCESGCWRNQVNTNWWCK